MRFDRFLLHRCTLVKPNQEIGKDAYNRTKYDDLVITDVHCRVDEIKKFIARDENGASYITENILFLGKDQSISNDIKIQDIKDINGNALLNGTFSIEKINPAYRRRTLHHYEVTLKKGD